MPQLSDSHRNNSPTDATELVLAWDHCGIQDLIASPIMIHAIQKARV